MSSRERFIAYINSLPPDHPIDYDAMWKTAERQALERAAKEAERPEHGVSAWKCRENVAKAIRSLMDQDASSEKEGS